MSINIMISINKDELLDTFIIDTVKIKARPKFQICGCKLLIVNTSSYEKVIYYYVCPKY